ncbi:MAG: hypothetical protein QM647_15010 [Asticcacaulis sp.]|uniref:DUF7940 domain-containing protein n=1 Tax=Asticcacaulis sp. TaxID=1872648 RepID=UPI0039E678B3
MKIIDNWKATLSSYSAIALAASTGLASLVATWGQVPDELKALIPQKYLAIITATVAAAGFIGRFIDQPHVTASASPASTAAAVAEVVADQVVDQAADAIEDKAADIVADAKASIIKAVTK